MANEFIIRKGFISKADSTIQGNVTANAFTTSGGTTIDSVTGSTFNTSTGNLTLTTISGATIVENLDGKYVEISGYTDSNNYISGATFNTTDGVLTLTYLTGGTTTVDLDDRYSLTGHTHPTYALESALVTHSGDTSNPHSVTQTQIGLSNVVNVAQASQADFVTHSGDSSIHYTQASISIPASQISDFDASVSANTEVALNTAKISYSDAGLNSHTGNTSNPHSVTKAQVGLTNVLDVEQATLAEYDIHTGDTSNPHSVTQTQVGLSNVVNIAQASQADFVTHSGATNPHITPFSGLSDTNISSPSDGQVLTWDVPTARWINDDIAAGNGNDYVTSGSFNTSSGVITLSRLSGGTVTYGLDGKYLDLSGGTLTGNVNGPAFVTDGGTINHFVKGDGSLQADTLYSLTGHTHPTYALESALVSHSGNTSNPHSVTQTQVGLSNVVNIAQASQVDFVTHSGDTSIHYTQGSISIPASQISDFDTEVSNNTDVTANTLKISYSDAGLNSHTGNTSNPHAVTQTQIGLSNVVNVEQATLAEYDIHTGDTSNPHAVTKTQVGLTNVVDVEQATLAEYDIHTGDTSNPHSVTQTQVGLGSVDDTSDADKPVSTATQTALDLKANESALVSHSGNTSNPHSVTKAQVGLTNVVDIAQASQADFVTHSGATNPHITPFSGLSDVNISSPIDGDVATWDTETARWIASGTTGGSVDLSGLTDTNIGTPSDSQVLTWDEVTNKWIPTTNIGGNDYVDTGSFNTGSGVVTLTRVSGGTVNYGINGKYLDLTGGTMSNATLVTNLNAEFFDGNDSSQFSLTGHTHPLYALESALVSHSGNTSNPHSVTKAQVGLTNVVDVEQATLAEYDIHTGDTSNPHSVTQTQVGLGSVDDTSDADKPVSTATQTALDLKANESALVSHSGNTSNPHSVTQTQVGLSNVVNIAQASQADFVTHSGDTSNPHSTALSGLTDSNVGVPTDGEVLTWDTETARWIASGATGGSSTISGSTDANVGTPADGEALRWDTETAKWIASGVTEGDVFKVGTPSNNQIGVWTGNGTLEGDPLLTLSSNNLSFGLEDATQGRIKLHGDNFGNGGEFWIYNGLLGDTDDDFYSVSSSAGVFRISGNVTGAFLRYTSSSQVLLFSGAVTSDQTNAQIIATGLDSLITKDFGDSAYVGSGVTYSLSGLTDTTFAITPVDGQNLTWNDSASSWSATTGGGGGDVTKVGTPANFDVAVWTGDGTLGTNANLTMVGTLLELGQDDVNAGLFYIYGGTGTVGGSIRIYNGGTGGANDEYYEIDAQAGAFRVLGVTTGDFFTYTSSSQQIVMEAGLLNLGANDNTRGLLNIYGDTGNEGGKIHIYNGGTGDTNDEYYSVIAFGDYFRIGAATTGIILDYLSATGNLDIQTSTVQMSSYGGGTITGTAAYNLSVDASGNIIEEPLGAGSLSGLSDTTFAITPTDGQALVWNDTASSWSANTISGATGPEGPAGADGDVTSGGTATLSNKRIQPRVVSATTYTTDTGTSLDIETCDIFVVTAQAGALLFNNPSGTPSDGEKIMIRIKDDGTARALTYGSEFRAMGNALPTTTVISKTLYMGVSYNGLDSKWDLIASAQEA
jgi:hypothetical protein